MFMSAYDIIRLNNKDNKYVYFQKEKRWIAALSSLNMYPFYVPRPAMSQ